MLIDRSTFIATDNEGNGTVEITLRNQTRRVPARESSGTIFAKGLVGRYHTSSKTWPALVVSYPDGREFARFGRDDRNPKFRKENCLWFID